LLWHWELARREQESAEGNSNVPERDGPYHVCLLHSIFIFYLWGLYDPPKKKIPRKWKSVRFLIDWGKVGDQGVMMQCDCCPWGPSGAGHSGCGRAGLMKHSGSQKDQCKPRLVEGPGAWGMWPAMPQGLSGPTRNTCETGVSQLFGGQCHQVRRPDGDWAGDHGWPSNFYLAWRNPELESAMGRQSQVLATLHLPFLYLTELCLQSQGMEYDLRNARGYGASFLKIGGLRI
jgi:hypothetical protein